MYLGSSLGLCSIFYLVWMQQCSIKWKAPSHLLTVKSGIMRCKIKAEHKPSLLVWARHCQRRRCLLWKMAQPFLRLPVQRAGPGLVQKLLPWSMVGAGLNLGHFCLTHCAFPGCFTVFTAESLCRIQNLCDSAENQREGREDLWLLVINELDTPRSLIIEDLSRTVQLICLS